MKSIMAISDILHIEIENVFLFFNQIYYTHNGHINILINIFTMINFHEMA